MLGGGISILVLLASLENIGFEKAHAVGGLGSSAAIGAIGITANQSMRQAEFLKLLVYSTNTASELSFEESNPEVIINDVKQDNKIFTVDLK